MDVVLQFHMMVLSYGFHVIKIENGYSYRESFFTIQKQYAFKSLLYLSHEK